MAAAEQIAERPLTQRRIALVGDYRETVVAHRAIPIALQMAVAVHGAGASRANVSWEWIHTRTLVGDVDSLLQGYAGVWCVPASPYANPQGALAAIRFARERQRPFLGTCGGFQHALIEYAASVWNIDAAHAEEDPNAINPVIAPLMCALIGVTGALHLVKGSRLAKIYGREAVDEEYHCSFGLNPHYADRLNTGALRVAARDDEGAIRAIELVEHPFFIGTLFQPERAALKGQLPPLVSAFVAAVSHTGK